MNNDHTKVRSSEVVELNEDNMYLSCNLMTPSIARVFTTENEDGTFNVAPFSWVKPTSQHPPLITLSLLTKPQKQRSLKNIERTREFVMNIVGLDMADGVAVACQKVPDGISKLQAAGLVTYPSRVVRPPRLARAKAYLECRATDFVETGDHCLIIAEVVAAGYERESFTPRVLPRPDKLVPCIHVDQFNRADTQAHVFLECSGARLVETEYLVPMKELIPDTDTW